MNLNSQLTDTEDAELNGFLSRVIGGTIPNTEALDGFFAALACCPDLVMPSEYMPVLQSGETEDGDLVFEGMNEARRFTELVNSHWNHVNRQLDHEDVYLPLVLEDSEGRFLGNDWANGFVAGTHLRHQIWADMLENEEHGGSMVPIWALAHENHPDPVMRPYKDPIDDEMREKLLTMAAAGVMRLHLYFLGQRSAYTPETGTFIRIDGKTGRNDPCLCGSGKKFKKCCGQRPTLH
jgi:uncharacterized protein